MLHLDAIVSAAVHAHLDPEVVRAVVLVESGGVSWAWNPEPKYRYLWDLKARRPFRALTMAEQISEIPPLDFTALAGDRDQEWWGQQASWGLMQVMGAVAREYGFSGPYLTQLCDVDVGLRYGCKVLADLWQWAESRQDQALAAYNAGRGNWESETAQRYVAKVHRAIEEGQRA